MTENQNINFYLSAGKFVRHAKTLQRVYAKKTGHCSRVFRAD